MFNVHGVDDDDDIVDKFGMITQDSTKWVAETELENESAGQPYEALSYFWAKQSLDCMEEI